MTRDTLEDIQRVQDILRRHPKPALVINQCNDEVIKTFKEIADNEFNGHYGHTLKWLIDFYVPVNLQVIQKIEEFENRLSQLEVRELPKVKKPREIPFLDGRKVKLKD